MFKGFYTATTGMIAQQRRTEMLSNNIANANTPGYKAEQSTVRSFPNMLLSSIEKTNSAVGKGNLATQKIGTIGTGVYMQETVPDYTQGSISATDLKTDVALIAQSLPVRPNSNEKGAIFFRLQAENGEAYTKNGNFTLDSQGALVSSNGNRVLSTEGNPIYLQNDDFSVSETGIVKADGEEIAQIDVAYTDNPNALEKRDNGLFYTTDNSALASAFGNEDVVFAMQQGYLEQSNVDAASTMTEMMTAYRSFEANQKMLQAYDRSMDKAVNEIGKV